MSVSADLLAIVDVAQGADWSTREYLKRFAVRLQDRPLHLGHHARCFRDRAEDFRQMVLDTRVDRTSERLTATLYDDVAELLERQPPTDVACGELCGFLFDGLEPYGTTKCEPCTCSCHYIKAP